MKKKIKIYIIFSFLLLIIPSFCFGYAFNSGAPLFGQENNVWCGAATGQMILAQGGVMKTQTEIYNTIQANKKDHGFYTDPDGLEITLNHFDSRTDWEVISGGIGTQDRVIEMIMERMVKFARPAGLLVDSGNHWVVFNSFVTDINPLAGDAELQTAGLNDPWPVGTGKTLSLNESDFNDKFSLNIFGTVYLNDYVGVAPIPEPGTILLMGLGLLFIAGLARRFKPVKVKK